MVNSPNPVTRDCDRVSNTVATEGQKTIMVSTMAVANSRTPIIINDT